MKTQNAIRSSAIGRAPGFTAHRWQCILAGGVAAVGTIASFFHPAFLVVVVAAGIWLVGAGFFGGRR